MQKLTKQISPQVALERAAALCGRAEYCSHEIRTRLERWGLPHQYHDEVINSLVELRYVDDRRFALAFARHKTEYDRWGQAKIRAALYNKRIAPDIIESALDGIQQGTIDSNLKAILESKRRSLENKYQGYDLQTRLIRFALSRGYSYDDIRRCL